MKRSITLLALATLTLFMFSCKKKETKINETTTDESKEGAATALVKLGETYIPGTAAKAIVYGNKEPETGYNEIYVALYDSVDGSRLSRGHFDVLPMMDMGTMQHSSPVENTEDTTTTDGYFKAGVIFSMPGNSSQWWLDISFHNHKNERFGTGKLGLAVKSSTPSKFKSTVIAKDSNSSVFISLVNPSKPIVGINDFEVVLNRKQNMMDYAPVEDYTIEIEPTMPSMGHGSPNNINPIHTVNGHYKGKVNFTMSGLWQIKLKLFKNDILISEDQFFEITI